MIETLGRDVRGEVDRSEIADRDLILRRVEQNLSAKVRRMHHAHVILRRADVGRILESDPRMPGLEEQREHLAPERDRLDAAEMLELAPIGHALVLRVTLFERATV